MVPGWSARVRRGPPVASAGVVPEGVTGGGVDVLGTPSRERRFRSVTRIPPSERREVAIPRWRETVQAPCRQKGLGGANDALESGKQLHARRFRGPKVTGMLQVVAQPDGAASAARLVSTRRQYMSPSALPDAARHCGLHFAMSSWSIRALSEVGQGWLFPLESR